MSVIRGHAWYTGAAASVPVSLPPGTVAGDRLFIHAWSGNQVTGVSLTMDRLLNYTGQEAQVSVRTKVLDAADIAAGSVTVLFDGSDPYRITAISTVGNCDYTVVGRREGAVGTTFPATTPTDVIADMQDGSSVFFMAGCRNATGVLSVDTGAQLYSAASGHVAGTWLWEPTSDVSSKSVGWAIPSHTGATRVILRLSPYTAAHGVIDADLTAPSLDSSQDFLGDTGVILVNGLHVWVMDKDLVRAPTAVVVAVNDGDPGELITFQIDGVDMFAAYADSYGGLEPTSVPTGDTLLAGEHTLTAIQGSTSGSDVFTLSHNPSAAPSVVGGDADPIEIPDALRETGVRSWVFQDLMPGGLGSYVFPYNPSEMSAPEYVRDLAAKHTTAKSGQFHVTEGGPTGREWTFSGYCPTLQLHNALLAYGSLNRRFYIIDHRNRAWVCAIEEVELVPRPRLQATSMTGGTYAYWAHDYTVKALILDQDPKTPV